MTALRDAGTRVSGIVTVFLMLLVAGISGGIPGTITGSTIAHADAPAPMITASLSGHSHADSTYLSLTRERMRQQLAARDLEAAARTLQWIRRIDPDDAVASVLATELQLRRGNVAAAAMRLIEVLDGSTATDASRAEAQRILTLLAQEGSGAAVMVTRAMLDAATLPAMPEPLLLAAVDDGFGYDIVDMPTAGAAMSQQILAFAATTPLGDMRAATGSPTPPVQLAAATAPVPPVPNAGQTPPGQIPTWEGAELIDLVFADPTNLQLNFALFQEQLATGDLDGAMVTLERVLIVDPESKLAKVLLADVNLKKGNLPLARNILSTLLA